MPTLRRRPSLRLIHRGGSPEEAMMRANQLLSEHEPDKAIKIYSKILYKLSPGSVCAFLNRSLAYILLQLPELAVVDAYRACMLANQMRRDAHYGDAKYQAASKYLRVERLHVDADDPWTTQRRKYIGGGWVDSVLAGIVINDVPNFDDPKSAKSGPFDPKKRQVVAMALEIRAIYRLSGALYMCGNGASSDALGLIDDARARCIGMESWERTEFSRLGNAILDDLMMFWDRGIDDPQGLNFLNSNTQRRQKEQRRKVMRDMKAKTTALKLGYSWNAHEPELDNLEWLILLRSWVHKCSSNCSPSVVDTEDIWDETSTPYVELRADRDINTGELVLHEQTRSNVTTSTPEHVYETQYRNPPCHYYCDTCSSLLIVPSGIPLRYKGSAVPLPHIRSGSNSPTLSTVPMSEQRSFQSSERADRGSSSPEIDPMDFSQQLDRSTSPPSTSQMTAGPPPPPPEPAYIAPSDFMFCCPTHMIPTCSSACRKLSEPFDRGLCHTTIERNIREDHLPDPPTPKSLVDRKKQCLIDLLLLRIFTTALNSNTHPLQNSDLVFATSGPSHVHHSNDEAKSWSFTTNVVRPIYYLDRYFEQTDTDQYAQLEKCEGWVINTLMAKIGTAMDVSWGPRFAKAFNQVGNLSAELTREEERFEELTQQPTRSSPAGNGDTADERTRKQEAEIWIGSLNPVLNMIRVADPAKGEVPNVKVRWREGVSVYAIGHGGQGLEPAIRAGEPLLRPVNQGELHAGSLPSTCSNTPVWNDISCSPATLRGGEGDAEADGNVEVVKEAQENDNREISEHGEDLNLDLHLD